MPILFKKHHILGLCSFQGWDICLSVQGESNKDLAPWICIFLSMICDEFHYRHGSNYGIETRQLGGISSIFFLCLKYKPSNTNVVVDALSRWYSMIAVLEFTILGVNSIEELYAKDLEFLPIIINNYKHGGHGTYSVWDGFLFKGNRF